MQRCMEINSNNKRSLFLIALLFIAAVFSLYVSFFGFDWSDETVYTAIAHRFVLGDSIFDESRGAIQISGLIISPFVLIYEKVVGSTEGIMLYMRVLYNIFAAALAFYFFIKVKKSYNIVAGFAGALIIILFAPHSVYTLGYNSISYLLIIFIGLLLVENSKKPAKLILAGFFYGISIINYPTIIILLPLFVAYILYNNWKIKGFISKFKFIFFFGAGSLILALVFIIFLAMTSSIDNLLDNFVNTMDKKVDTASSSYFSNPIINYVYQIKLSFGKAVYFVVVISSIACIYKSIQRKLKRNTIKVFLMFVILIIAIYMYLLYWGKLNYNFIAVPIAVLFPAIYILNFRKPDFLIFLYTYGIFLSFAVFLGSNTGMSGASYGLMISNIAAISYMLSYKKMWKSKLVKDKMTWIVGLCFLIILAITFSYLKLNYVYRDEPIRNLDARISSGPGAGLYTTKKLAKEYDGIYKTILENINEDDRVFFTKLLPFGYTSTNARPAVPTLYRTEISSEALEKYYNKHPNRIPTLIFKVKDGYGFTNENNPVSGYLGGLINEGTYDIIDTEYATIYKQK